MSPLPVHGRDAIDLQSVTARCVQIAYDRNTSTAIRDLKQRLGNP